MEALTGLLETIAAQGPLGLALAVVLALLILAIGAIVVLYRANQDMQRLHLADAKDFARGLSSGIATLDAVKELLMNDRRRR